MVCPITYGDHNNNISVIATKSKMKDGTGFTISELSWVSLADGSSKCSSSDK